MFKFRKNYCQVCQKACQSRCSKCQMAYYCSRECQVADFKNHKGDCNKLAHFSLQNSPENSKFVIEVLSKLPNLFEANLRLPLFNGNEYYPLELLVPQFILQYLPNFQSKLALRKISALTAIATGNHLFLMSTPKFSIEQSRIEKRPFIPFTKFCEKISEIEKENLQILLKVYLILSFNGACNQMTSSFGYLLLQMLQNQRQVTYLGERIIGWAIQGGHIIAGHPNISRLHIVSSDDTAEKIMELGMNFLTQGQSKGLDIIELGRPPKHEWLTFVLESGRIFELDLSAFQFGVVNPFPCILNAEPLQTKAFQGTFDRESIFIPKLNQFAQDLDKHFNCNLAPRAQIILGNTSATGEDLKNAYIKMNEKLLERIDEMKEFFRSEEYFWEAIKNL